MKRSSTGGGLQGFVYGVRFLERVPLRVLYSEAQKVGTWFKDD